MKIDALGGRRWLTAVAIILLASGMLVAGLIKDTLWGEVVTWVFGIFSGANVTQRGVEAAKEVKAGQQAQP